MPAQSVAQTHEFDAFASRPVVDQAAPALGACAARSEWAARGSRYVLPTRT